TPTIARRLGSHNHRPEGTTARPFRCAQVGEGEHAIPVEVALEDANRLVRVVDDQNAAFSLASNPARQPLVPGGAGRFGGGLVGSHRKAKEEACPLSCRTFDPDLPLVKLGKALTDREAQSAPAAAPGEVAGLMKLLEDVGKVFRGDSW